MKSEITISVIIPCYNSQETIKTCLESVLKQTESVNEIIVVDDGSKDQSVDIINEIIKGANNSVKLILHKQTNQGPSLARNNGVKLATCSHIAFLDSDDEWFLDHIRISKHFLENNTEFKIIATKYLGVQNNYTGEVLFEDFLTKNYLSTPCVVLNKVCFWDNGGFNKEMKYSEDYYLWLNIVFKNRLYKIDYIGAKNINNKRSFGDKGLSSNLLKMHVGVIECYDSLYINKMINFSTYVKIKYIERLKYLRRIILTFFYKFR